MSDEVIKNQDEELFEKDITSLVEDVDEELEEIEELANEDFEEFEGVEEEGRRLMSEEEFNERLDEFQEKDHSLTIFANYYVKILEKQAEKQGIELDTELWWSIGRPSFNAGLWYMEKVEGQAIQISGKFGLLIGAGSLLMLTIMYQRAKKEKKQGTGEEEKPVKTETEALRERAKPKEPEKLKSELLDKISKNLGS